MPYFNQITLIGHLGKSPELKSSGDNPIATVSLATTEKWKDRNGEQRERTDWHDLVFFGKPAQIVADYWKKGDAVFVQGQMLYRHWEDKDGNKRISPQIKVREFASFPKEKTERKPDAAPAPDPSEFDDIPF